MSVVDNRREVLKAISAGAAVSLAGCLGRLSEGSQGGNQGGNDGNQGGNQGGNDGKVKVGLLAPISGPYSSYGSMMKPAAKMAVKNINSDWDKEVTLSILDTQSKPDSAMSAFRNLIEQKKVDMVMGPVASPHALTYLDYYKRQSGSDLPVLLNAPSSSPDIPKTINCEGIDRAFHMSGTSALLASGLLTYGLNNHGTKFQYIGPDDDYGHSSFDAFKRLLGDRGTVDSNFYKKGRQNFSSLINKISQEGPDAIIGDTTGDDTFRFINDYNEAGMQIPIVGNQTYVSSAIIKEIENVDVYELIVSAAPYSVKVTTGTNQQWIKNFKNFHPQGEKPNRTAQQIYDLSFYFKQAAEKAGSTAAGDVASTLDGATVTSVLGDLSIRKKDNQLRLPVFIQSLGGDGNTQIMTKIDKENATPPVQSC